MTGNPSKSTFSQATLMALEEAMSLDERVILLGEDIADGQGGGIVKATQGLSTRFGTDRVRSTPISEQAILGAGIGAALAGYRPVCEIMLMNFTTVAMDMIVNHAAKLRYMSGGQTPVPLTVRTMSGAGGGQAGQHADMLEAWFAHTPGLKVVVPSCPEDQKGLLLSCIFDDDPCIFVETTMLMRASGPAPTPGRRVPLGKAEVLREGSDVSVIGYGRPIRDALALAEERAKDGVSLEIIDLKTIVPMDMATVLASVQKTRRAVIVHEAVTAFGVGAEISSRIHEAMFDHLLAPVARVGAAFTPIPFSRPLEIAHMWGREKLADAIQQTLNNRGRS